MGRIVINETENKQTIILNDSQEGVEGGYYDSQEQWHEFGKSDKTFANPEAHITAIRGENVDSSIEIGIIDGLYYIEDGYLTYDKFYLLEDENETEFTLYATSDGDNLNAFYLYVNDENYHYEFDVTNTVNCSFSGGNSITVSDISKPCSFTVTYTEALPIGG